MYIRSKMESSRTSKSTGTSNAALVQLANYYQCQYVSKDTKVIVTRLHGNG